MPLWLSQLLAALFQFGLGLIPDSHDTRDKVLSATGLDATPRPEGVDLDDGSVVWDQGGTSSCVGQMLSEFFRLGMVAAGVPAPPMSALWSYYFARAAQGVQNVDGGSSIRDGFKMIARHGIAPAFLWPFVASKVNKRPSVHANEYAFDNRQPFAYERIAERGQDRIPAIVGLLNAKRLVGCGFRIGRSLSSDRGGVMRAPTSQDYRGLHALLIVGYKFTDDGLAFIVKNSWGQRVGVLGRHLFHPSYVADPAQCFDLWTADFGKAAA